MIAGAVRKVSLKLIFENYDLDWRKGESNDLPIFLKPLPAGFNNRCGDNLPNVNLPNDSLAQSQFCQSPKILASNSHC